jgi:hypothetical protein
MAIGCLDALRYNRTCDYHVPPLAGFGVWCYGEGRGGLSCKEARQAPTVPGISVEQVRYPLGAFQDAKPLSHRQGIRDIAHQCATLGMQ